MVLVYDLSSVSYKETFISHRGGALKLNREEMKFMIILIVRECVSKMLR